MMTFLRNQIQKTDNNVCDNGAILTDQNMESRQHQSILCLAIYINIDSFLLLSRKRRSLILAIKMLLNKQTIRRRRRRHRKPFGSALSSSYKKINAVLFCYIWFIGCFDHYMIVSLALLPHTCTTLTRFARRSTRRFPLTATEPETVPETETIYKAHSNKPTSSSPRGNNINDYHPNSSRSKRRNHYQQQQQQQHHNNNNKPKKVAISRDEKERARRGWVDRNTSTILRSDSPPPGKMTQSNIMIVMQLMKIWARRSSTSKSKSSIEYVPHVVVEQLLQKLLQERDAGNKLVKINTSHYNTVLIAYANSNDKRSAERSHQILSQMEERYWQKEEEEENNHQLIKPDVDSYTAVIKAYVKNHNKDRRAAISIVENIIERMEECHETDNDSIDCHNREKLGRKLKEQVPPSPSSHLSMTSQSLSSSTDTLKFSATTNNKAATARPNRRSYNLLLYALANSSLKDAPIRAERILQKMISSSSSSSSSSSKHVGGNGTSITTDLYNQNDADCKPDINSFNQVLGAWGRGNQKGFEAKLDSIFSQLLELMEEQQERDSEDETILLKPNADTFNAVLNGWLKSKRRDAIQQTERLIRTMENLNVKPNRITINTIQSIFAKSGSSDSLEKSIGICSSLEKKYRIKADRISSTIALVSLCKSGQPDAPERAMEILDSMEHRFKSNGKNKQSADMPNEYIYTSVIDCFVKNQRQDAPQVAELLLKRMRDLQLYHGGDQVSTPVLNSVINAWASCSMQDVGYASIRVRQLLQFMEAGGEKDPNNDAKPCYYPKPNRITYNTVMKSMGVSGMDCDAEYAEEILKRLERKGQKEKNPDLRPDKYSYTAVITAYGRSSSERKAAKAFEILKRQIRSYRKGNNVAKPNIHPFNAALNACAYCNRGCMNTKSQAFEIAMQIYGLLIREFNGKTREGLTGRGNRLIIRPDQTTYGTLLRACATLLPPGRQKGHDVSPSSSSRTMALTTRKRQKREESYFQAAGAKNTKIEEYFQAACKNGYVGRLVITQMKFAASSKQYEKLMGRNIMDRTDPKDLPSSWTRNVKNDKRR